VAVHSLHTITASVTGTSYSVPAVTIYSQGFETNSTGWSAASGTTMFRSNLGSFAHGGSYSLDTYRTSSSGQAQVKYTLTGLTVGLSYTITAWAANDNSKTVVSKIGVTGLSYGSTFNAGQVGGVWAQGSYTFTATATSHEILLEQTDPYTPASTVYEVFWDDVQVVQNAYLTPLPLDIKSASITLDDSWNRYVQGELVINPPDPTTFELLNPLASPLRVSITGTVNYGSGTEWNTVARSPVTRTFDLALLSRVKDEVNGEVTLTVESDEALLAKWTKITTTPERTTTLSVQDAVTYALGKIGATLQAGAADATLTASSHSAVTASTANLAFDPRFARGSSGVWSWNTGASGTNTQTFSATGGPTGIPSYARFTATSAVTVSAASPVGISATNNAALLNVNPNTTYTSSVWVRSSQALSVMTNALTYTSTPTLVADSPHVPVTLVPNTWTQLTTTWTTGSTIAKVNLRVEDETTNLTNGTTVDVTGWMLQQGTTVAPYFDGDSAQSAGLGYYWAGQNNLAASYSINEPVLENTIPNTNGKYGSTGWTQAYNGGGAGTLSYPTTGGPAASAAFVRTTVSTSAPAGVYVYEQGVGVSPSTTYFLSAWVRTSSAATVALQVNNYNSASTLGTSSSSTGVALTANTWTRLTFSHTTDSTAASMWVHAKTTVGTLGVGATFDVTALTMTAGASDPGYFDGNTTGTNTYGYEWTGAPGLSPSIRTGPHLSNATIWLPGVSALDYVAPLVQAGGLRLFCDEQRRWYLVDPTTYTVAGTVSLSPDTGITQAKDSMSLEDSTDYATAVVVQYNPPADPATGLTPAPVYDIAGSNGGPVKVIVHDQTQYPGPGAAAAVLNRASGKGRTFSVSAETQLPTTPGMALTISLPDDTAQLGVVSNVTWRWPDAQMDVGSKGLTNTAANAWVLASGAWSAATGTWSAATGTS